MFVGLLRSTTVESVGISKRRCLLVCLLVHLSIRPSVRPSACPSAHPSVRPSVTFFFLAQKKMGKMVQNDFPYLCRLSLSICHSQFVFQSFLHNLFFTIFFLQSFFHNLSFRIFLLQSFFHNLFFSITFSQSLQNLGRIVVF